MVDQNTTIFPERTVEYAGFWERFFADFLDGILLSIVSSGLSFAITGSFFTESLISVPSVINIVVYWLYDALQESSLAQATLGKRALNLKVTNLEIGRISFWQATGRHFAKYLSFLTLLIGYLMMLWDSKKQTLHDKIAGTLVLRQENQVS